MSAAESLTAEHHASKLELTPVDLSSMTKVKRTASIRRMGRIGAVFGRRVVPVVATNVFVRDADRKKAWRSPSPSWG